MTLLVTIARYRAITGDTATESTVVSARLEQAQELLADELERDLPEAEYTETLWPTRDGMVWPSMLPITDPGDYTQDGAGLVGVFGPAWPNTVGSVEVTYRGGWVERTGNPGAANRLPAYIEQDLAFAAHALATTGPTSAYPAGATSVRLGDAAITFGPDGAPRGGVGAVHWSRRTLRHKAHIVRGAGGTTSRGGWVGWF